MLKQQFNLALLQAQEEVIAKVALEAPLAECLESICLSIETILAEERICASILLLEEGKLKHGAAPSLDPAYNQLVDGLAVGEGVGSCGTSMHRGERVIVSDIFSDPLWQDYRELIRPFGYQACWSTPIFSSKKEVLGSFAIYTYEPRKPNKSLLELIDRFTNLASLAIEHSALRQSQLHSQANLASMVEQFKAVTHVMPDLGFVLDQEGRYIEIYGSQEQLLYDASCALLGKTLSEVLPPEIAASYMQVIEKAIQTKEIQIFEYVLPVPAGLITFEGRVATINSFDPMHPKKKHVIWMARDISERKKAEKEIERLALFDSLTELPNRRLLQERLSQHIHVLDREQKLGALLFIDLDDFKRINDSLGHTAGDDLLCQVAKRLSSLVRHVDTVARLGGDEFVVLLGSTIEGEALAVEDAKIVAEKIMDVMRQPFVINRNEYKMFCSVGISLIYGQETQEDVLKRADSAMYRSKRKGGHRYQLFDANIQSQLDKRLAMESDIIRALGGQEFATYFQPQVNCQRELIGAEALIRWHHPEQGTIYPNDFIAVAERFGLIHELQTLVLQQSCQLLQQLLESGKVGDGFTLSVNISPIQFKVKDMDKQLIAITELYGIERKRIKLEVTEGMLLEPRGTSLHNINKLKEQGFSLSVDDFGTGYSSLAYLQKFPIDELKIDRSFVQTLPEASSLAIIQAVVGLSQAFGFSVIAEGVETEAQLDALKGFLIHGLQGFLFAKPMAAADFMQWIQHEATQQYQTVR